MPREEGIVGSIHMAFGWRWHWILCKLGIHFWREKYQCRMVGYFIDQDCIYCPAINAVYDGYNWVKPKKKGGDKK